MESQNLFGESKENPIHEHAAPRPETSSASEQKEASNESEFRVQVAFAKYLREKIASEGSPLQPGETFNGSSGSHNALDSVSAASRIKDELSGFGVPEDEIDHLNSKQQWELLQTKALERELKATEPGVHVARTPESVAADFEVIQATWETAAKNLEESVTPERYKEFLGLITRAVDDISILERFLKDSKDLTAEETFYVQMVIEVKNARMLEQKILPHSPDPEIDMWPKDKQAEWKQKREELELVGFEHGEQGIERNILDTVIVLNLLGMNTSESCEGHTHKGSNVPFVVFEPEMISQVYSDLPNSVQEMYATLVPGSTAYEAFTEHIKKEMKAMEQKLQAYLDEFNARSPRDPYNFVISEFTPGQSFMILPEGFGPDKKFKPEYREAILGEARKKMVLLTAFLKEKYLAQ